MPQAEFESIRKLRMLANLAAWGGTPESAPCPTEKSLDPSTPAPNAAALPRNKQSGSSSHAF